MSIEYVRAVLEMKKRVGTFQRVLLIAIAEHADRNGIANPGNELLADETEISERQVQRLIAKLEAAGMIETKSTGNGRGYRRLIRLLIEPATLTKRVTLEAQKGDTICHPSDEKKGDIDEIKGDKRVTSERKRVTLEAQKGDMLPEVEADNPINPINPKPIGGDLDQVLLPHTREDQPTTPPPVIETLSEKPVLPNAKLIPANGAKTVRVQSPYLTDARRFVGGYIPAGQGLNPVEVYYERFSINNDRERLTAPLEDDLARNCPELERLREVITAYGRRRNYAPGNIQLILDWYRSGIPNGNQRASATAANEPVTANPNGHPRTLASGTIPGQREPFGLAEVKLTAQLVNKRITEAEYQQRYAALRSAYGLPDLQRARPLPPS
jgi:SOS-response transcriptional repressor LexA